MSAPSFAIVASRFNERVTDALLKSCILTLKSHRAEPPWVVRVPGAFEIPWAVRALCASDDFDVVVALGCILKGETDQNVHLARSTIQLVQRISVESGVPCVSAVLTPDSERQALARTRGRLDRGREAALAALDMARVRRDMDRSHPDRRFSRRRIF